MWAIFLLEKEPKGELSYKVKKCLQFIKKDCIIDAVWKKQVTKGGISSCI